MLGGLPRPFELAKLVRPGRATLRFYKGNGVARHPCLAWKAQSNETRYPRGISALFSRNKLGSPMQIVVVLMESQ